MISVDIFAHNPSRFRVYILAIISVPILAQEKLAPEAFCTRDLWLSCFRFACFEHAVFANVDPDAP